MRYKRQLPCPYFKFTFLKESSRKKGVILALKLMFQAQK